MATCTSPREVCPGGVACSALPHVLMAHPRCPVPKPRLPADFYAVLRAATHDAHERLSSEHSSDATFIATEAYTASGRRVNPYQLIRKRNPSKTLGSRDLDDLGSAPPLHSRE